MDKYMDALIQEIHEKIIGYRRDFHKYPEVGWTEFRTASKIADVLTELGFKVTLGQSVIQDESRMGVPSTEELNKQYERAILQGAVEKYAKEMIGGFTGVVGTMHFGEGPTVGMRFDIDALKVKECNAPVHFPVKEGFVSINEGIMHACGHDSHAAIGLGVAEVISKLGEKSFQGGTVKLIFQPAEEGVRGAKSIVDAGVLNDVDYIISGHMMAMESGTLICGANGFMATTKLDVTYKGLSAHAGAAPNEGNNSLLAACTAVLNLHSMPRHADGESRVNVGQLVSGSDRNVIPEDTYFKMEIRGENNDINAYLEEYAGRIIKNSAEMHGVEFEIKHTGAAPSGAPSQALVRRIKRIGDELGIFENVLEWSDTASGSEDFMYMMNSVQSNGGEGAYFIVGTDKVTGHHTSTFDIVESDMTRAVALYTGLLQDFFMKQ